MRVMLKSKIHGATITETNLAYEGSIGIDDRLLREADLLPYEQVHVLDVTNGNRFETYAIQEPEGYGRVAVYGAAARLVAPGDTVIVLGYQVVTEEEAALVHPRIVHVDGANVPIVPIAISLSS